MNRQKTGLAIFIIGFLLAAIMGVFVCNSVTSAFKKPTLDEVNQTMWRIPGFWFFLWSFGVPIGAVLAGIGALMRSKTKASTIWLFGSGTFLGLAVITLINGPLPHIPVLFGIGGTLILAFFFGIWWLASKKSKGKSDYLILTGYTFLVMGMWFTCGELAREYFAVFEGPGESPINVMIFFVLAWLFLFLGHYQTDKT